MIAQKDEEQAEVVLNDALKYAKEDKAISAELERLRQRKKAKIAKEKAAYKKMFN